VSGPRSRWTALGVLCTGLLVIVIDNTIVNVALPTLARDLDADTGELQWVADAYTLVFAGLLLLAGTLGDRFGRRRTLLCGLAVFGLASGAAAAADRIELLVAGRAVMGAGAAFIMPATLSLLVSVFTDARERATAIGLWAATAGLGVALGPVVGGVLLDHFWWGRSSSSTSRCARWRSSSGAGSSPSRARRCHGASTGPAPRCRASA